MLASQRDTPKHRERALDLLNERHFAIRLGAKYVVCDELIEEQSVLPQSDTEFKKRYRPVKVPTKAGQGDHKDAG